ncbi:hypothetical protein [Alcanivorax sediminis]|nr:hypothetical protein [Alcanivorax sediminis]
MPDSTSRRAIRIFLLFAAAALIAGCAKQPEASAYMYDPPGFFMGLFHGFAILFSMIGSFFMDIRIYSFPNSGLGYDIGFFLGAAMFLGGGGASAK